MDQTQTTNYNQVFNDIYSGMQSEVDKYIQDLVDQANGDFDFASKWIEANYKQALGTNDSERQNFFKQVANSLEEKQGRIVYDYNTGKYRTEQDMGIQTQRVNDATQKALQRLDEDYKTTKAQSEQQNALDRSVQDSSLNSRGIVSNTRENATGLQGMNVNQLETDISGRMDALERSLNRGNQDITTSSNQQLSDINLTGNRSLADLTTASRRAGQDAQTSQAYNTDKARQLREAALNDAEKARRSGYSTATTLSNYLAKGAI